MNQHMYSVVIADDEDIIREGFITFIPWEEFNFKIVKTCENGQQVLDYIKEHPVDFILTDIKMVGPTGLDIARYVHENNLSTIVCLVSGYRDFEYARIAIKYNVKYYLTKPTEVEDVIEMVREVAQQLEKQYAIQPELSPAQFFTDIFMGNYSNKTQILSTAETLGLRGRNLFLCPFWVRIADFDAYISTKWNRGKELLFTAVSNFMRDSLREFTVYTIWVNHDEFLFLAVCDDEDAEGALLKGLEETATSILCMMDMHISCQTGHSFNSMDDFCDYFTSNIWMDDASGIGDDQHSRQQLTEMYKNLIFSILLKNNERLQAGFQNISAIFSSYSFEDMQTLLAELLGIVFDKLNNLSARDFRDLYLEDMNEIKAAAQKEEALQKAQDLLLNLSEHLHMKNSPSETIIEQAKTYIAEHYSENISLEDVANFVYLNASYLSRLFKQYTGDNFRDYLINIRIAKAIELIHENKYKIWEIGELCGYKNPKYFSQQFKHITGLSPKEYLNQQGHNS